MVKTQDQVVALEVMQNWYKQNTDLFCTINGAAGTGKTTITKEFIDSLGISRSRIAVSAPTHKAKKVIQSITGYTGTTIQKLLGLRPNTDIEKFNINRPQFDPLGRDELNMYSILILDESSMINSSLYTLLKKKAIQYKVKVLFLGDEYQLPPINEKISKVFSDVKFKATLTTVVRQGDDNPMSEILLLLREDIKKNTSKGVETLMQLRKNVIQDKGFKCLTKTATPEFDNETFGNQVLQFYFSTEYQYNKDYIKFISYTNENVEQWSSAFRKHILKEDANNFLNIGEAILGYNSITDVTTNDLIIENSGEYIVKELFPGVSSYGIEGFYVTLENIDNMRTVVFVVNPADMANFKEVCIEKLNLAKGLGGSYWKAFYSFKNKHLLLENVYFNDDAPKLYHNLLCKKDLFYNYGLTVHKSQGSTYDNVAINLKNLYINKNESERARLIYVALSRARNLNLILVD